MALTASPAFFFSMTQDIFISLVEIISIFILFEASASNIFAATPACVFMPMPTTETFAILLSEVTPLAPIVFDISFDTLSGGEKTIMLAALVACIQKLKTGKVGIGLFELAEADSKSVKALLGAIEAIGYEQVVIASCHGKTLSDVVNIAMAAGEQKDYIWSESGEVAA